MDHITKTEIILPPAAISREEIIRTLRENEDDPRVQERSILVRNALECPSMPEYVTSLQIGNIRVSRNGDLSVYGIKTKTPADDNYTYELQVESQSCNFTGCVVFLEITGRVLLNTRAMIAVKDAIRIVMGRPTEEETSVIISVITRRDSKNRLCTTRNRRIILVNEKANVYRMNHHPYHDAGTSAAEEQPRLMQADEDLK